MNEIEENITNEIIIKNSRFITYLFKVNSVDESKKELLNLKIKHPKANHLCYAYIINNDIKFSDDGEPSGTAGSPIYNVLSKNNINKVLCVVVRYFGGVKLGAGGLVRAYSNSASEALQNSKVSKVIEKDLINIEFKYTLVKIIDNLFKEETIVSKQFADIVKYKIEIKKENLEHYKKMLTNLNVQIKK